MRASVLGERGMSTTSFGNTPQATDDYFPQEATLLTEDTENIAYLAVMADDLGGKAKVLYSLDDGSSEGGLRPIDLLQADAVGATNYSELGARIWITSDGKIAYDTANSAGTKVCATRLTGGLTSAQLLAMLSGTSPSSLPPTAGMSTTSHGRSTPAARHSITWPPASRSSSPTPSAPATAQPRTPRPSRSA
jgi:hypothetical protein